MKNKKLRLGFSLVTIAGVGLAWACSDTNNGAPVGTPSPGSSQSTGTSTTVPPSSSSSSTTTSSAASGTPPEIAGLIDDMSNIQSDGPGTDGSWYTYSDRTIANSEPPIIIGTPPGSVVPAEGASFPPNNGDASLFTLGDGAVDNIRECSGGGETDWGAGFGLDLLDGTPDGGPVAINACPTEAGIFDTSPDASSVGIPQQFDASAYTGFSFWGISLTGKDQSVNVQVDDDQTSPWGGICNVCQNGGTCAGGVQTDGGPGCPCSDNFIEPETFTTSWKQFVVRWTDTKFKVQNWSHEGNLTFHPKSMYNIHFQFTTTSGTQLAPFDVAVALLQWVGN